MRVRALDANHRFMYASALADAVALLASERFNRAAPLRTELVAALLDEDHRGPLEAAARSSDSATRRAAVRLLLQVGSPLEVLRYQLSAGDVVATALAAEASLAKRDSAEEAAHLLLRSGMARFRERALGYFLATGSANLGLVIRGLADLAASVRGVAQRAFTQAGRDPFRWYDEQLETEPLVALLGFGDLGGEGAVVAALAFTEDPGVALRAAALRVVARHGGREHIHLLVDHAIHDSGRVAREAMGGIFRQGVTDDVMERAWRALDHAGATARRRIFQRLLPRGSRWIALRYGLLAVANERPDVIDLGLSLLERTRTDWKRSFTKPGVGELEQLRSLLDAGPGSAPSRPRPPPGDRVHRQRHPVVRRTPRPGKCG